MMTVLPVLIGLLSVALLARGLRGRRVGREPFCPRCGYNLTGQSGTGCSECGEQVSAHNIRIGIRRRRPASIGVGLVLGVISGIWLTGLVRGVNWYDYAPFDLVLLTAKRDDAGAFGQLKSRLVKGTLSPRAVDSLAEVCLTMHRASSEETPHQAWINLLDQMDSVAQLSPEQQNRYYGQVVEEIEFEIRQVLGPGDPIVLSMNPVVRPPSRGLNVGLESSVLIDGEPALRVGGKWSGAFRDVSRLKGKVTVDVSLGPGRHDLLHVATICVFRSSSSSMWKGEVSSSRDFEVVPASQAAIRLTTDPSLAEALRDAILPKSDLCHHGGGTFKGGRTKLLYRGIRLEIVRPMPVSVAFDVFVFADDTEHHAGTLSCEKGSTKAEYDRRPNGYDFEQATGRVILRSNPELALKTIALHEIWDGELELGVFPVGRVDE